MWRTSAAPFHLPSVGTFAFSNLEARADEKEEADGQTSQGYSTTRTQQPVQVRRRIDVKCGGE